MQNKRGFIEYHISQDVEAFSIGKDAELPYDVIQPHQIHGDCVAVVTDRNTKRSDLEGIDALVTNLSDCPIAVRTADCVPILLYDPKKKAIAAVHSGWRGTVKMIVNTTIETMERQYGTKPSDLLAVIGPSIGPESFFVHGDVREAFLTAGFPVELICWPISDNSFLIDLWKANSWLLEQNGVNSNNIQITGICTYIHHDELYSARYEKNNKCGRNINVIKLKNKQHLDINRNK